MSNLPDKEKWKLLSKIYKRKGKRLYICCKCKTIIAVKPHLQHWFSILDLREGLQCCTEPSITWIPPDGVIWQVPYFPDEPRIMELSEVPMKVEFSIKLLARDVL